jgi:hypothetical protein
MNLLTAVVLPGITCKKDKDHADDEIFAGSWQPMEQEL